MSEDVNHESGFGAITPDHNQLSPVDNRVHLSRLLVKWFFGISILLVLISLGGALTSSTTNLSASELIDDYVSTELDTSDDSSWDSSWIPDGYTEWSMDSTVAYKWADDNNCDEYGCISANFITRDGCPNGIYVALNWLDGSDSVVSYSNASLPSLLPMQTATLRFDDYEEAGESGQISEINCR